MEKKDKVDYWVDISEYDLKSAAAMLKSNLFLYVGFMCHQAIEKILKAYYVHSKDKTPPFTHNLSFLAKESDIYSDFSNEQKIFIDLLEPLNIEARYPSYKEKLTRELDKNKSKNILTETRDLHQWIKEKLSIK